MDAAVARWVQSVLASTGDDQVPPLADYIIRTRHQPLRSGVASREADGEQWRRASARIRALWPLDGDDDETALHLLESAGDLSRWPVRDRDLLLQLCVSAGRKEAAQQLLAGAEISPWIDWAARVDLAMSDEAYLAALNEPLLAAGLAPVTLSPAHTRFAGLTAGLVAPVDGPLVTVVMSSYQPTRDLISAARSVLASSWQNLELLVVDDASPGDVHGLYDEVRALDDRVRVVQAPHNRGTYEIRNLALTEARGEFMTFHDSDDFTHPQRIEHQIRPLMDGREAWGTRSYAVRAFSDGSFTYVGYTPHRLNASSLLFRVADVRTAVGGFDHVRKSGDMELPLRMRAATSVGCLDLSDPGPLAITQLRRDSLSRSDVSPGWTSADRLAYRDAYLEWHERIKQGSADPRSDADDRPFPLPSPTWNPDCTDPATGVMQVERIVIGDPSAGRPRKAGWLDELTAMPGSVAVAGFEAVEPLAPKLPRRDRALQRLINARDLTWLDWTDECAADVLHIAVPGAFLAAPQGPAAWKVPKVTVEQSDPDVTDAVIAMVRDYWPEASITVTSPATPPQQAVARRWSAPTRRLAATVAMWVPPQAPAPVLALAQRARISQAKATARKRPLEGLAVIDRLIDSGRATAKDVRAGEQICERYGLDARVRDYHEFFAPAVVQLERLDQALASGDRGAADSLRHSLRGWLPRDDDGVSTLATYLNAKAPRLGGTALEWLMEARLGADLGEMQRVAMHAALLEALDAGPSTFVATWQQWSAVPRSVAEAVRVLASVDRLAELHDLLADLPVGADLRGLPTALGTLVAGGHLTHTLAVTDEAIRIRPRDQAVQSVHAMALEKLDLLTHGWPMPERRDPRKGATNSVLAVLGQSLPLRNGGYATRSHGLLLGLQLAGWTMSAVTRLGFPFDMWLERGTDVTVPDVDIVDGITYHRLLRESRHHYPRFPLRPFVNACAAGVERVARQTNASLIHASSLFDVGLSGLTAARHLGLPFVYEVRGLKSLLEEARDPDYRTSEEAQMMDRLELDIIAEADHTFVITQALLDELVRMGADPERMSVVPNGVDTDAFRPLEPDALLRAELGLQNKIVVGYLGGMPRYEGLETLLAAVAASRDPRLHAMLVGDGNQHGRLTRLAVGLGIEDRVTFVPRVPHAEVASYASIVDIACYPRHPMPVCELISPMKPFEMMAMAKPVVVSDVAALTEIVTEGVTGRTFAKGDAEALSHVLDELADDPAQRDRLGQAGRREVVASSQWSYIAGGVDDVYRRLLG